MHSNAPSPSIPFKCDATVFLFAHDSRTVKDDNAQKCTIYWHANRAYCDDTFKPSHNKSIKFQWQQNGDCSRADQQPHSVVTAFHLLYYCIRARSRGNILRFCVSNSLRRPCLFFPWRPSACHAVPLQMRKVASGRGAFNCHSTISCMHIVSNFHFSGCVRACAFISSVVWVTNNYHYRSGCRVPLCAQKVGTVRLRGPHSVASDGILWCAFSPRTTSLHLVWYVCQWNILYAQQCQYNLRLSTFINS